jgi:catechol 2,3-dioxygenase-like lactoylglutathione lyase family enzyme
MAKLRHVAIMSENIHTTAAWFRAAFELEEVGRWEVDDGGVIYLSDGTVNVAIVSQGPEDHPNHLPFGLNHIGFVVDDREAEMARLEQLGAKVMLPPPPEGVDGGYFEVKLETPEGLPFDISHHRWPGVTL